MSDACSLLTAGLQYVGRESPTLFPSASLSFRDMGGGEGGRRAGDSGRFQGSGLAEPKGLGWRGKEWSGEGLG